MGALSASVEVLGTLRKFLGSKEHLDLLKIDLNATEIITDQDSKTHRKLMWIEVHIFIVKVKNQVGNIWVKDIMATQNGQSQKKFS